MSVKSLNRYKLIGGPHIAVDVTAEPLKDAAGQPILLPDGSPKYPVRKFEAGELVVSSEDLVQKHRNKFVFAGPYGGHSQWVTPVSVPSPVPAKAVDPNPSAPPAPVSRFSKVDLKAMTVADLRSLAAEEEVDIASAHLKDEIIDAILAATTK